MMMQASMLACIIYAMFERRNFEIYFQMCRHLAKAAGVLGLLVCFWQGSILLAQQSSAPRSRPVLAPEKAISLAEQGRCGESISALKHAMTATVPAEVRKQAGVLGVRCSLALDDRDSADEFIRLL